MKLLVLLSLMVATVTSVSIRDWMKQLNVETRTPWNSGSKCLNGGTAYPLYENVREWFCVCPRGFSGRRCDVDESARCIRGDGQDYRGKVSQSENGKRCLAWKFVDVQFGLSLGLEEHNYCRNPDSSARPWCWVRRGRRVTKQYCDIPQCDNFSTCGERSQKQYKVVGGTVTTVEKHPWITSIFQKSRSSRSPVFLCGGTLISPCWVLSAAHCFPDGVHTSVRRLSVVLGKNAINETDASKEQEFEVEEVIPHEGFDNSEGNFNNDIALLKIRRSGGQCAEETATVRTVCLPPEHRMLPPGVSCDVVGYGKESDKLWYNSQYLREAKLNILNQDVCSEKQYYGNLLTDNMFCAGSPDWSRDACKGDSGGPLVCEVDNRVFLFGVVSWGDGCSKEFRPGVYTKVTNYNSWIEEKTGLSSITAGSMYPEK
ncbi:hypothetical protein JZ751_019880 [Albula glossodonta]|uniref:Urokinase-type plasminogen activator n=1 Tax=Albula glossodonta TaxID=121402 RepID=A0A8T2NND5_9TELE|nr:hypothetical protein JZ751_019880 [Albula glossodonta]